MKIEWKESEKIAKILNMKIKQIRKGLMITRKKVYIINERKHKKTLSDQHSRFFLQILN